MPASTKWTASLIFLGEKRVSDKEGETFAGRTSHDEGNGEEQGNRAKERDGKEYIKFGAEAILAENLINMLY